MATETFRRLPEEKRERFLNAAWAEFTRVSFAEVSINQIVRTADVPRGSFYQYFTNKQDLFVYLMEQVFEHLLGEYHQVLCRGGGDIFATQLLCYDRFVQEGAARDPQFQRLIRVLQLNSGMSLQMVMSDQAEHRLPEAFWSLMDRSGFRSQEREFVQQTFFLTLLALAAAVMAVLRDPAVAADARRELAARLEIIKHGSLAPDGPARDVPAEEVAL